MPEEIKYDANATPPQFTNNADMVIEPGTQVRVKIIGTRTEVGEMWAIGSIHGDFLGYVLHGHNHALYVINASYQVSASLGRLVNRFGRLLCTATDNKERSRWE